MKRRNLTKGHIYFSLNFFFLSSFSPFTPPPQSWIVYTLRSVLFGALVLSFLSFLFLAVSLCFDFTLIRLGVPVLILLDPPRLSFPRVGP